MILYSQKLLLSSPSAAPGILSDGWSGFAASRTVSMGGGTVTVALSKSSALRYANGNSLLALTVSSDTLMWLLSAQWVSGSYTYRLDADRFVVPSAASPVGGYLFRQLYRREYSFMPWVICNLLMHPWAAGVLVEVS